MNSIVHLMGSLAEIARVAQVSVEVEDGFDACINDLGWALREFEELRALTRCRYYVLTKHCGDMYSPCQLREGHAPPCKAVDP